MAQSAQLEANKKVQVHIKPKSEKYNLPVFFPFEKSFCFLIKDLTMIIGAMCHKYKYRGRVLYSHIPISHPS